MRVTVMETERKTRLAMARLIVMSKRDCKRDEKGVWEMTK